MAFGQELAGLVHTKVAAMGAALDMAEVVFVEVSAVGPELGSAATEHSLAQVVAVALALA